MSINRVLIVQKLKALATHLSISAVLVAVAVFLMLTRWFPQPLFETDGGGVGLKLIVLVDLVLGPLLTFVVFNPRKSRRDLVMDLGLIAAVQLAAFGWGIHNIHQVRVQTLAYYQGQFWSVTADTYAGQVITPGGWSRYGARAPYVVAVGEPKDGDQASGVAAYQMMKGLKPQELEFLYQPFVGHQNPNRAGGWTYTALSAQHADIAAAARAWASRHSLQAEGLRYYRLQGFFGAAVAVFDPQGQWLGGFSGQLPVAPATAFSGSPTS